MRHPSFPKGTEPVQLDPAELHDRDRQPVLPDGARNQPVYRETDAEGAERRVVVTVTNDTKTIAGIEARVVHDVVSEDGQPVEDTFDWYAQDSDGNLWYLGEDTKEYENGKVKTTAGSWEAGVDGAQPGIIVPAHPAAGMTYREEYYAGEAEDGAEILTLGAQSPFRTAPSTTCSRRGTSARSSRTSSRRSSTPGGSGRSSRSP